jgi:hypothetical protein
MTSYTKKILFLLLLAFSSFTEKALATDVTLDQTTGVISVLNSAYTNDMDKTWTIYTGVDAPIVFTYTSDLDPDGDYVVIYNLDNAGNLTEAASFYEGMETVTTTTGRAKVVFHTNDAVSYEDGYKGFTLQFATQNSYSEAQVVNYQGNTILSGNVGIGTLSPLAKLHVAGSIRGGGSGGSLVVSTNAGTLDMGPSSSVYCNYNTSSSYNYFNKTVYTSTGKFGSPIADLNFDLNFVTRMAILRSNGYVGIGTKTPTQALSLKGNLAISPTTVTSDEKYNGALMITKPAASGQYLNLTREGKWAWSIGTVYNKNVFAIGNASATDASFAPAFVIDTVGRVGIGIATPQNKLDVVGDIGLTGIIGRYLQNSFTYDSKVLGHYSLGWFDDSSCSSYGPALWTSAWGGMKFFTRGMPRITIDYLGNVGIGNTTPSAMLDVAATSGNGIRIGKIGDTGNLNVSKDSLTAQYNIDFSGYRDILLDQIGARISALRFNGYAENSALVQKTGLGFYTNPTGYYSGVTGLVEQLRIMPNGNVGIGTTKPDYLLTVNGTIHAKEVKIDLSGALADYVFDNNYDLMPLHQVEQFVKENKHLPEIPSAKEVQNEGLSVGDMQNKLLQKVEELTLYAIEQQKRIEQLEQALKDIKK